LARFQLAWADFGAVCCFWRLLADFGAGSLRSGEKRQIWRKRQLRNTPSGGQARRVPCHLGGASIQRLASFCHQDSNCVRGR